MSALTDKQEKILGIAGTLDKLNDQEWEDVKVVVFDFPTPTYLNMSRIKVASRAANNPFFYQKLNKVLERRWPEAALNTLYY